MVEKTRKKKGPPTSGSEVDEAVVAALREGHREFLRFVARRAANMADAEDILQDFYLKVVRSARTIQDTGSLRSWLAQVLRRTLTDYYRKKGVRRKAQKRLEAMEDPTLLIDDEAERAVCACLYRILPTLPGDYAEVIWRIDLLGEPREKVAKGHGISPNNLAVRVHRARRTLRAALERFCTTCPTHGFLNCACEEGRKIRADGDWFERVREATVMERPSARLKGKSRSGGGLAISESPGKGRKKSESKRSNDAESREDSAGSLPNLVQERGRH